MPKTRRRRFKRSLGKRPYRKLFIIAVEGVKTEPQYFKVFKDQQSVILVKCLKGNHRTSPPQVLRRIKDYLKKEALKKFDEAWLVVDKDQWTDEQLMQLLDWSKGAENYGFALSNPKFEYWLLLHFEDGTGIANSRECTARLRRYLPGYDKGINSLKFTRDRIDDAVRRAKRRDTPPCADWPRTIGGTTVYRLIENILRD